MTLALKEGAVPCGCPQANNRLVETSMDTSWAQRLQRANSRFSGLFLLCPRPQLCPEGTSVWAECTRQKRRGKQSGARGLVHLTVQEREGKARERTEMRPLPLQVPSIHPSTHLSIIPVICFEHVCARVTSDKLLSRSKGSLSQGESRAEF